MRRQVAGTGSGGTGEGAVGGVRGRVRRVGVSPSALPWALPGGCNYGFERDSKR